MPTSFQVRASLVEVPLLSTSTNDRCGFRVKALPPPSPLSLSPTPLLRHGVGPLPLRLLLQTLFASPFPLPHRHLRFTSVSMRSNSNAPRNLRLLFRLVRTGICTTSSGRRTAAGRHHLPTRNRTDERTGISLWHSLNLSPRTVVLSASIFLPTPNVSVAMAFDRSLRQPFASPTSPTPSIAVHGSCLPVNSDRYGLRVERLFPPARLCLPDTAPSSRCRSLRLHLHSQTLFDGSASLRCQPVIAFGALLRKETSACFSEPSMSGCCSLPPFHAVHFRLHSA